MIFREWFYLNKSDRQIALALLTIAVVAFGIIFLFDGREKDDSHMARHDSLQAPSRSSFTSSRSSSRQTYYQQPARTVRLSPFDPNTADSTQLLELGLQPWQVRNIYKYRAAGGIYRQKEDFARLYGLTVKQYRELEPYIRISADYQPASTVVEADEETREERDTAAFIPRYPVKIQAGEHVDINAMDTTTYRTVPGIGSYYARKIAEYGRRLGGYVSVDQLDEIDDFPAAAKQYFEVEAADVRKINVNQLSLNELKRHPYINYYQAKAIVDYRRLYGPLKDIDVLRLQKDFSDEAIARLRPYVCY